MATPYGTPATDVVVLTAPIVEETIDLLAGIDSLTLADATNDLIIAGTELVKGGSGDDTIRVLRPNGATVVNIDGAAGRNAVTLGEAGLNVEVRNVQTVIGSAGDDVLGFYLPGVASSSPPVVNLGQGLDSFFYARHPGDEAAVDPNYIPTVILSGVEAVVGSRAASLTVQFADQVVGAQAVMGGGSDTVLLSAAGGPNSIYTRGVETVVGSSVRDTVKVEGHNALVKIDLGEGTDRVELAGTDAHLVELRNVEAVLGSSALDGVFYEGASAPRMSIDLGAGRDAVLMGEGFDRDLLVSNLEELYLAGGEDRVLVRTMVNDLYVDGGAGTDAVTLATAQGGGILRATNVETINGSSGGDRVIVSGTASARLIGNAGDDALTGGSGADTIIGGLGKDLMRGGFGADVFLFNSVAESDVNTRDIIYDFVPGQDKLVFTNITAGNVSYLGERDFTAGGQAEVRFVDASDQLLIDVNGDGAIDMRMALLGVDGAQFTGSDMLWVVN